MTAKEPFIHRLTVFSFDIEFLENRMDRTIYFNLKSAEYEHNMKMAKGSRILPRRNLNNNIERPFKTIINLNNLNLTCLFSLN